MGKLLGTGHPLSPILLNQLIPLVIIYQYPFEIKPFSYRI